MVSVPERYHGDRGQSHAGIAMKYDSGMIALWRKFLDWEWYEDVNTKAVFIHLLLIANWKDKKWQGRLIKRGQCWISRGNLAKKTGLSVQNVRTALEHLEATGEITKKSTNSGMLITIEKYKDYQIPISKANQQDSQQANKPPTSDQPQLNKDNKDNKRGKEIPPPIEEVKKYISEKGYDVDAERWYDFYAAKGWMIGKNKMKDWKAAVRTWAKRDENQKRKDGPPAFKEIN